MQAYSEGGHSQLFLLSDSIVSSLQPSSAYGQEQTRSSDGKKEIHIYWIVALKWHKFPEDWMY